MTSWKIGDKVWYIGNDIGPSVVSGTISQCDTVRYLYLVNNVWVSGYRLSGNRQQSPVDTSNLGWQLVR